MKAKNISLLVLPTILLSSCTFLFGVKSFTKDINVYDLDKLDAEKNLSSGLQNTVKARFISGQDYIPYLTLDQYASLYKKHFASDVTSKVDANLFSSTWTVSKGETAVFIAAFDHYSNEVIIAGSLQAAYSEDDDPRDLEALNYGMKFDAEGKYLSENNYASFNYSGYGLTTFSANNERYFPLGLLDITFSDSSGIYSTYNYANIVSTRDIENYGTFEYVDNGTKYTFDSQMKANQNTIKKTISIMVCSLPILALEQWRLVMPYLS